MNLRDLAMTMENKLVKNNISWRYVSARDSRTLVLEDGMATVLTLRYARDLDNYLLHVTRIPKTGVNLITTYYVIYSPETLVEVINSLYCMN